MKQLSLLILFLSLSNFSFAQTSGTVWQRPDHPYLTDVFFDPATYLAMYPDLQNALGNNYHKAADHWLQYGLKEGRYGCFIFSSKYYMENNPDVAAATGGDPVRAVEHWITHGIHEGRSASPVYHGIFYGKKYPDVTNAFAGKYVEIARHWLRYGITEKRQASTVFNLQGQSKAPIEAILDFLKSN